MNQTGFTKNVGATRNAARISKPLRVFANVHQGIIFPSFLFVLVKGTVTQDTQRLAVYIYSHTSHNSTDPE